MPNNSHKYTNQTFYTGHNAWEKENLRLSHVDSTGKEDFCLIQKGDEDCVHRSLAGWDDIGTFIQKPLTMISHTLIYKNLITTYLPVSI